jgi:hypothetical protein
MGALLYPSVTVTGITRRRGARRNRGGIRFPVRLFRHCRVRGAIAALLARVTSPRIYGCNSRQPQFVNIPSSFRP